jgi:hypothetical protein
MAEVKITDIRLKQSLERSPVAISQTLEATISLSKTRPTSSSTQKSVCKTTLRLDTLSLHGALRATPPAAILNDNVAQASLSLHAPPPATTKTYPSIPRLSRTGLPEDRNNLDESHGDPRMAPAEPDDRMASPKIAETAPCDNRSKGISPSTRGSGSSQLDPIIVDEDCPSPQLDPMILDKH